MKIVGGGGGVDDAEAAAGEGLRQRWWQSMAVNDEEE